jgi:hypothetical protein
MDVITWEREKRAWLHFLDVSRVVNVQEFRLQACVHLGCVWLLCLRGSRLGGAIFQEKKVVW